jgi:hypothetical protein
MRENKALQTVVAKLEHALVEADVRLNALSLNASNTVH